MIGDPVHPDFWKKCNECKKPMSYGARYFVCNVSTCNRPRHQLRFCSVSCWGPHVEVLRHRDSWAIEETAPTKSDWEKIVAGQMRLHLNSAPEPKKTVSAPVAPKPKTLAFVKKASGEEYRVVEDSQNHPKMDTAKHAVKEAVPSVTLAEQRSHSLDSPRGEQMNSDSLSNKDIPDDVLVVVSKLKAYIKARSDMNTSADVIDRLSDQLRRLCDQAILRARQDGRKTVMARDF